MEKFSVLMSVYAREQSTYLEEALRSVFEQTVPPSEVVLVKDGPLTTELETVIASFAERYKSLKIVALAKNMGLGNALNVGLSACTYRLVARMDSDDLSLPNRFETQLKAFEKDLEVSVVGGWISEFENNPKQIISYRKVTEFDCEIKHFFLSKCPVNHMTVMFRKEDILKVGGYQHFYLLEDYWLWTRMINEGCKFYNIQNILVNVRGGAAMAARRGGWKYVKSEIKLQWQIWKMGLIGVYAFSRNIFVRFSIHMMPSSLRCFFYKKVLR